MKMSGTISHQWAPGRTTRQNSHPKPGAVARMPPRNAASPITVFWRRALVSGGRGIKWSRYLKANGWIANVYCAFKTRKSERLAAEELCGWNCMPFHGDGEDVARRNMPWLGFRVIGSGDVRLARGSGAGGIVRGFHLLRGFNHPALWHLFEMLLRGGGLTRRDGSGDPALVHREPSRRFSARLGTMNPKKNKRIGRCGSPRRTGQSPYRAWQLHELVTRFMEGGRDELVEQLWDDGQPPPL
jgi:hypothetical protein